MIGKKGTEIVRKHRGKTWIPAIITGILSFLLGAFFLQFFYSSADATISLQKLVDSAAENEVIFLDNNTYEGNLVITKPISIVGKDKTVIKGDGTGNVITVKAANVRIENVTVTNSSFNRNTGEEYAGIKLMADQNIIKNVTITDCFHGVYLSQSHGNEISRVRVTGRQSGEIAGQGNGLHVYYSNNNKFMDNEIFGTRDGIFFDYSNNNETSGNKITHTRYGLHYMYSDNNKFYRNVFGYNLGGAAIMYSKGLVLSNNQFSLNQGTRSYGLLLQASDESTVSENVFYQNQRGIFIDQSQNNIVSNNDFVQNQIGIEAWSSSANSIFTENNFSNNIAAVLTIGGKDKNNWSQNGRGNCWGPSIPVLDLDQNGIGDYPVQYKSSLYQLVEDNELAYLFLKSPAIKIYEKMNEFLNMQEVMFTDEYPLTRCQ